MTEIYLVSLDAEKIKRILDKHGVAPAVTDLLLEMHDTNKNMEKLINDMFEKQGKIIEALVLVNKGFSSFRIDLNAMKKKYGDPAMEHVTVENLDG